MLGSSLTSLFTGLQAKLQYQIFGEPTQKAKDSNFSMSIFASGSAPSESKSGDQKGTFGPGGYPWKATISTSAISYGLSTGYRWTPPKDSCKRDNFSKEKPRPMAGVFPKSFVLAEAKFGGSALASEVASKAMPP
jgi:hypothetical protein